MAETVLIVVVAALFGFAFGHNSGFSCCLSIMESHAKCGMAFHEALEYEWAVRKGEVPRG